MRKWRCLFAPFDARLALPRARSSRRPAERKGPSSISPRLPRRFPFPRSLPSWRVSGGITGLFFLVLLEIAPVISTIGDEDIFALAEKCFSLRPSPGSLAPSVSFTYKRTRLCAPALTRGLLLPPLQTSARAPRIPSESVAFESPRRTDGRSVLRLALGDFDDEEEESVLSRFSHEKPIVVPLSHSLHPPVAWNEGGLTD